jgi:hypothetical protein
MALIEASLAPRATCLCRTPPAHIIEYSHSAACGVNSHSAACGINAVHPHAAQQSGARIHTHCHCDCSYRALLCAGKRNAVQCSVPILLHLFSFDNLLLQLQCSICLLLHACRAIYTCIHTTYLYISAPLFQVGPPGCFVHVSITTPVVSAFKNYYI